MDRCFRTIFVGIFCGMTLLFLLNSFYATPVGDDFIYLSKGRKVWSTKEIINESKNHYFNWEGRYVHHALKPLVPSLFYRVGVKDDEAIVIINAFVSALSLIASLFVFGLLFFKKGERKKKWFYALFFVGIFLLNFASVGEFTYWMTGSLAYNYGLVLVLLLVFIHERKEGGVWFFFKVLILFLVCGVNEPFALISLSYLLVSGVSFFIKNKLINKEDVSLFLLCLLFTIIVLVAPGNFKRMNEIVGQEIFSFNFRFLFFFKEWIRNMLVTPYGENVFLLSALFALFARFEKLRVDEDFIKRMGLWSLLASMLTQILLNYGFGSHYNVWTASRIFGFFTFFSLSSSIALFLVLFRRDLSFLLAVEKRKWIFPILKISLLLIVLRDPILKKAVTLSMEGYKYRQRYRQVASMLEEEKKKGTPEKDIILTFDPKDFKGGTNGLMIIPFAGRVWTTYYGYGQIKLESEFQKR